MQKRAFTFIEIIIVITITIMISVLAATVNNNFKSKTLNTRTTADIATLDTAFTSFAQDNSTLPQPGGNTNFFKEDTSYSEPNDSDAYGVYGQITSITLPSKYINFTPLDPATGAYYSYGKMLGKNEFEIAGVIREDGAAKSIVQGNYSAKSGPYNLIREYNGPNFVYDRAHTYFPYNPEGLELNARLTDLNGTVTINGRPAVVGQIMRANDIISVPVGAEATLYFGDGSKSILGDNSANSTLVLNEMSYPQDNSLVSQIALVLNSGTIWTNATQMGSDSQFTIQSGDTTAAVRGTIFGVRADTASPTNSPDIEVVSGKVEVTRVEPTGTSTTTPINSSSDLNGSISALNTSIKQGYGELVATLKTEVVSYDSSAQSVILKMSDVFKNDAEYLKVGNKKIENTWSTSTGDEYTFDISDAISEQPTEDTLALSFCKASPIDEEVEICTRENRLVVSLGYVTADVDGEVDAGVLVSSVAGSSETTTEIGATSIETETPTIPEVDEEDSETVTCDEGDTINAAGDGCETIVCSTIPTGWDGLFGINQMSYDESNREVYRYETSGINSGFEGAIKTKYKTTAICNNENGDITIDSNLLETFVSSECTDSDYQYFTELDSCLQKQLDGYDLVAYAPYTIDTKLYKINGGSIGNGENLSIPNNGVVSIDAGTEIKYDLGSLLSSSSQFMVEVGVTGTMQNTSGFKEIFNLGEQNIELKKNNSLEHIKTVKPLVWKMACSDSLSTVQNCGTITNSNTIKFYNNKIVFDTNSISFDANGILANEYGVLSLNPNIVGTIDYIKIYRK